jgi:hypothetical protein
MKMKNRRNMKDGGSSIEKREKNTTGKNNNGAKLLDLCEAK